MPLQYQNMTTFKEAVFNLGIAVHFTETAQKTEELEDGSKLEIWNLRRDRFDSQNHLISRFVLTTVGRVVMNYTIIDSVSKT